MATDSGGGRTANAHQRRWASQPAFNGSFGRPLPERPAVGGTLTIDGLPDAAGIESRSTASAMLSKQNGYRHWWGHSSQPGRPQSGIGSARTTGSGTTTAGSTTGSGRRLRRLMAARAIAKVMTARVTPVEAISVSVSVLWLR